MFVNMYLYIHYIHTHTNNIHTMVCKWTITKYIFWFKNWKKIRFFFVIAHQVLQTFIFLFRYIQTISSYRRILLHRQTDVLWTTKDTITQIIHICKWPSQLNEESTQHNLKNHPTLRPVTPRAASRALIVCMCSICRATVWKPPIPAFPKGHSTDSM